MPGVRKNNPLALRSSEQIPGVSRIDPRCKICSVPSLARPLTKDLLLRRKTWKDIVIHYSPMYEQVGAGKLIPKNLVSHKHHCVPRQRFALEHLQAPATKDSSYLELPPDLANALEVGDISHDVHLVNEFAGLELLTRHQFTHLDLLWKQIEEKSSNGGGTTASMHKALVSLQSELRATLVEKYKMRTPESADESKLIEILIGEVVKVIFSEITEVRMQKRIEAGIDRAYEFSLKMAKKSAKDKIDVVEAEVEVI